jgi:predicted ATPase/class 3 adenylate cyclase
MPPPSAECVTLLFTDIEGSTRLARTLGQGWRQVLVDHHRLVHAAIVAAGGHVERTAGDSFFAIFADPVAAVGAAAAAQRALAEHAWPPAVGDVRVRMGLHTGLIERSEAELTGLDIHLVARVEAAAHGGQILMTAATQEAIAGRFAVESLGQHRLKDFPVPERLFQLVYDGRGAAAFSPLRTAPVRPTNLPADTRRLVGREDELTRLRTLLVDSRARLVTVVGLGGSGKTRLAVAAGVTLLSEFDGGVWLVPLAGVSEPEALPAAIASALGVADDPYRPVIDVVVDRLSTRPTLLVLDNFEQIIGAARLVAGLLDNAPACSALITTQLPLRVEREHVFRLQPLRPDAAVELFAARAASALEGFSLEEHRDSVDGICARLDCMPLAIELAAARVATMPPRDLLGRLDRSLHVLTRGPRDLAERHRSLRKTLEWTIDLLDPEERLLLSRMAAFAGPAPIDAIEAVAAADGTRAIDTLNALAGLLDACLAQRTDSRDHGVRFTVPQAVRDFAGEELTASGEEHAIRAAHAAHVAGLAEACRMWYPGHADRARASVLALLDEQRPALAWSRDHDAGLHLRVASALGGVLKRTGRHREATAELTVALERNVFEGAIAGWAGVVQAWTMMWAGRASDAIDQLRDATAALRLAGDEALLELGLRWASCIYGSLDEPEIALEAATEALSLARLAGDPTLITTELLFQAQALILNGRLDDAEHCVDEADVLLPGVADSAIAPAAFRAELAAERGDWRIAARGQAEHAVISDNLNCPGQLMWDLGGLSVALVGLKDPAAALEVDAMNTAISEETGEGAPPLWSKRRNACIAEARANVTHAQAAAAVARGLAIPAHERVAHAVALADAALVVRGDTF